MRYFNRSRCNHNMFLFSQEGKFRVMVRRSLIRHFEDMIESSETGREQIIDVRNPTHFVGESDEPSPCKENE